MKTGGYIVGLRDDDIPLEGRITAVVDVFDALTSKRPYREQLSIERALDIIQDTSGEHFDPACVDAFFQIKDEIISIAKRFQNETPTKMVQMRAVSASESKPEAAGYFQKRESMKVRIEE